MVGNPIILPAGKIWSYYGAVAGPIDPTYQLIWGTDAQSARPVRALSGTATYTVTIGGKPVNFVAIVNHNVTVNVGITGGVSTTLVANAAPPDDTLLNPYSYLGTPATTSSLAYAVSGNPETVVIGELICGEAFQLARPFPPGTERVFNAASLARDDTWGMLPGYDLNAKTRKLNTQLRVREADLIKLQEAWEGQRGYSLPSGIVPRPDKNDFWYGFFIGEFRYSRLGPDDFTVPFNFQELGVTRW